jgi:UDP-glucose 4-epimerase
MRRFPIIGGVGFIGSHFVSSLMTSENPTIDIDNFCSESLGHLSAHFSNPLLKIIDLDVRNTDDLIEHLAGVDTVIHLASNPDIAKAATDPRIDFIQGTILTESVVGACRIAGVRNILYASGSGVYGDSGEGILNELSHLEPISTYGASKLAGEAPLSSYPYMFGIRSLVIRFANVVGPKQTHGVGFDFLWRLRERPNYLAIMGDGQQSKA